MKGGELKTRSQKILAIPLIAGILAGIFGLGYLFSIPGDPKNALIFGFSLFRILEGFVLLTAVFICLVLLINLSKHLLTAESTVSRLGFDSSRSRGALTAWILSVASAFLVIQGEVLIPRFAAVIQRLLPVIFWMFAVSLVIVITWLVWIGKNQFFEGLEFLFSFSMIGASLIVLAGLIINPADMGLVLRQGSLLILVVFFFNLKFAFQKSGLAGGVLTGVLIAMLFGGSILGVWMKPVSDLNIIAGLLPFNDANGYFHGSRMVAESQPMFPFAAKRPLFSALMGSLMWFTGQNLTWTIGLLVVIGGITTWVVAMEVNRSHGPAAAAFFAVLVFSFARRFIGSTMSEVIGLPFGVVGFAFLWSGAVRQRLMYLAAGMLMVSLGLLSRAGPFFLLPLLVLWAGWGLRGKNRYSWKAFLVSAAAAGMGFLCNTIIFQFLAGGESAHMSNFSYSLYGLVVGGKGWKQYAVDHPDVLLLVDPFQSQAIYRYAFEEFKAHPLGIVEGAFRYWQAFFSFEWYGAFAYISGSTSIETMIGRAGMAVLSGFGILFGFQQKNRPEISMILAGMVGILLSVPFVPPLDAEIRPFAAAIPWFIGLGMVGLIGLKSFIPKRNRMFVPVEGKQKNAVGLWSTAIGLVILMVIVPLGIHTFQVPFNIPTSANCPDRSNAVITTIYKGSYINIQSDEALKKSFVPNLRYSDFVQSMHDSPMYSLAVGLMPVKPGTAYFTGYNWAENRFEDILVATELIEKNQGWVEMCEWRESDEDEYGFFHADTVRILESGN